ncbi:MAG: acyltransferase, partial [Clostridiales bacterium]|nr:acyltransferase [Clostridiales bacterium]
MDTDKTKEKPTRLLSLDGLRGIAACLIAFGWHYQHFYISVDITPRPLGSILSFTFLNGWLLADLFFIISGFSTSLAYQDRIIEGKLKYKGYLIKRIKRIYPLHLITLLVVAVLQMAYRSVTGQFFVYPVNDLKHFILNIFLLNGGATDHLMSFNGPAWYLGILFLILLVFFPVVRLCKSERIIRIIFVAVTLLGIMLLFINGYVKQEHLLRGVTCFSIGVLISCFRKGFDKRKKLTGIVSASA